MVTKKLFGITKDGLDVYAYTITNDRGIAVTVLDYGATLQSVVLPHKVERIDVVLGYDTIEEYENNDGYLGASIGRFAGRIPDAVLRIHDEVFPVTANEGKNQLHGGRIGFDKRVWETVYAADKTVRFCVASANGDEGYPGSMMIHAAYTLRGNTLEIDYLGTPAPSSFSVAWNPTNHAYWNLNGHDAGDARKHLLEIPADRYIPVGPDMIPTGGEADVAGTQFDFRTLREIGDEYDHSFVLSGSPIRLWGNRGIGMEIRTNCTAVQFYNAKFLGERCGKGGAQYGPFGAVCLETEGRQMLRGMPIAEENILVRSRVSHERITKFRFIIEED
ncbi:MAG: galactose mutarotase [Clostridia bacterium]|nr:galactose mutarotase [Clostridia bacterium]